MAEVRQSDLVFPGFQGGAIADNGLTILTRKLAGVISHGFRSIFRDWAAERSNFPHEVAEMALGHTVGATVERADRRGDLFEKRRQLAEAWSRFCSTPASEAQVVPIRRAMK
jgi:integrase